MPNLIHTWSLVMVALVGAPDTVVEGPTGEVAAAREAVAETVRASTGHERGREGPSDGPAGDAAEVQGAAEVQDPTEVLRKTSRAYEAMRSIRADFVQELENTMLGRTTRSSGTLYQREPDKFLMDFADPEGDLIVSDGRYFWMYFPSVDEGQVLRMPRGGQGLDLQAQFVGDVNERFDVTYHGTEEVDGRTTHAMTLDPRESVGYRRLEVWIDARDHMVRRFVLTEANGNVRHMELRDMAVNPTLPDTLFEFTPPPDALVVDRGG